MRSVHRESLARMCALIPLGFSVVGLFPSPCRTCPKPVDVFKRANSRTARPQGPSPASLARSASLSRRSVGADRRGPPAPGRMLPRRARPAARRDGSPGAAPSWSKARAASWAAPTVAKFRCVGRSGRRARARSRPTGSLSRTARTGSLVGADGVEQVWPARPWPARPPPCGQRRCWCPSRLLGASGCSLSPAWRRMPTMPAVPDAASAHAGPEHLPAAGGACCWWPLAS